MLNLMFQLADVAMLQGTVGTAKASLMLHVLPTGSIAVACYI